MDDVSGLPNARPPARGLHGLQSAHLDARRLPARHHLINRMVGDEAQVFAARLHVAGFGLEFLAGLVEVELLGAEGEGVSTSSLDRRMISIATFARCGLLCLCVMCWRTSRFPLTRIARASCLVAWCKSRWFWGCF